LFGVYLPIDGSIDAGIAIPAVAKRSILLVSAFLGGFVEVSML
jgi:hypothetical protein